MVQFPVDYQIGTVELLGILRQLINTKIHRLEPPEKRFYIRFPRHRTHTEHGLDAVSKY